MKINKKLNIVLDVSGGQVHAMPIGYATFEKYFEQLARLFDALYTTIGALAAPRVAALELRKLCMAEGTWEGAEGVENGLMNEIYRLSNYISLTPDKKGWQTIPLMDAIQQGLIEGQEKAEVANALVFFTCVSWMHREANVSLALHSMTQYWGGATTLLDCTEYAASLPISTEAVNSGATATPSPIPS
jgi:hypothetical protein